MWLAGLLLKPQMLVLVIPIIILLKYWKVFLGFIYSSILIISGSLIISGWAGLTSLISLWSGYGGGIPTNAINLMINWRMLATNLTSLINPSIGWLIAGLGIVLSLLVLFFLIKQIPALWKPALGIDNVWRFFSNVGHYMACPLRNGDSPDPIYGLYLQANLTARKSHNLLGDFHAYRYVRNPGC